MTLNALKTLNFLKSNFGSEFTKQDIAKAIGVSVPAVTGSVNALINGGYAEERVEVVAIPSEIEGHKPKIKETRYVRLTEEGLDLEVEEA